NGESWKIGVQNPLDLASDLKTLDAKGKNIAVATSGITKRKGMNGSVEWNHIIDPRTGLSVKNNLLAVTVISDKVYKSDVFAKTALILGEKEGIDFINKQESAECVAIDKDLNFYFSKNAKEYFV
ncbi:FAD:protein FMN transferase, partial [Candidatus Azambacteria bacterium]|nr:FAD:protein FMN transferase [Candidatus Azambacteria bacterium]